MPVDEKLQPAGEAAIAALHTPRKGLVYGFPYLDASVSRVVYLLRNRQLKEAAVYLTNLVNKVGSVCVFGQLYKYM
uniref:DDE_Tnp_Tn3 domain-containing protein n=1 Tax=Ascaris lumbricoides TaxID=6252 RepID=A0A0M3HHV6_ASCLU